MLNSVSRIPPEYKKETKSKARDIHGQWCGNLARARVCRGHKLRLQAALQALGKGPIQARYGTSVGDCAHEGTPLRMTSIWDAASEDVHTGWTRVCNLIIRRAPKAETSIHSTELGPEVSPSICDLTHFVRGFQASGSQGRIAKRLETGTWANRPARIHTLRPHPACPKTIVFTPFHL